MRLKMKSQSVTLKTKDKYLTEDIEIVVDNSVINNQENTLKKLLDVTKSCKDFFRNRKDLTINDVLSLIQYNDTENVTNMDSMFYQTNLTELPLLNTSNVTDMGSFCDGNKNITTFPQYNTSKVINMYALCRDCSNLTEILELDTSNLERITGAFSSCNKLEKLPPLNTNKVTSLLQTFQTCYKIPKIDISHYNISSNSDISAAFNYCYNLKALIIRSFGDNYVLGSISSCMANCYRLTHTSHETYNPNNIDDGYIYIPRAMIETLQSATNWSAMYFRALEDYTVDGTTTGEFDDAKAGLV